MTLDLDKGGRSQQVHQTYLGPSLGWIYTDEPTHIEFVIGSPNVIQIGLKGYLTVKEWCIIQSWVIISNLSGNITFDIWKKSLSDFEDTGPPTVADSIVSIAPPRLTAAYAASSTILSGWDILLGQNDVLAFYVSGCLDVKRCSIILRCIRTLGQP